MNQKNKKIRVKNLLKKIDFYKTNKINKKQLWISYRNN